MPNLDLVRRFVGNGIGISAIRRMAPAKTLPRIRAFLNEGFDLVEICKGTQEDYSTVLDRLTEAFLESMPEDAKHWGMARKCLNLFLRDALYNVYLHEAYALSKFESVMEVPLDRSVGEALREKDNTLPSWGSVISLTKATSAKFQAAAAHIAAQEGTFRVHLDLDYWRRKSNPLRCS